MSPPSFPIPEATPASSRTTTCVPPDWIGDTIRYLCFNDAVEVVAPEEGNLAPAPRKLTNTTGHERATVG